MVERPSKKLNFNDGLFGVRVDVEKLKEFLVCSEHF